MFFQFGDFSDNPLAAKTINQSESRFEYDTHFKYCTEIILKTGVNRKTIAITNIYSVKKIIPKIKYI